MSTGSSVPLAAPVEALTGELPAGTYAVVAFVGHPDQLIGTTAELLDWARRQGMSWDMRLTPDGEQWGCLLEVHHTDPRVEPDMNKRQSGPQFRLAG